MSNSNSTFRETCIQLNSQNFRHGGPYKDRLLRSLDFREELKRELHKIETGKYPARDLLSFPPELLQHICSFLSKEDLIRLCLVCKAFHGVVLPILYSRYTPAATYRYESGLESELIDNPNARLWKQWTIYTRGYLSAIHDKEGDFLITKCAESIRRLQGVDQLLLTSAFGEWSEFQGEHIKPDIEDLIVEKIGSILFPNLTTLHFSPAHLTHLRDALQHATKLTTLSLFFHQHSHSRFEYSVGDTLYPDITSVVAETVGQTLRSFTLEYLVTDIEVHKRLLAPLSSKARFPKLKHVHWHGSPVMSAEHRGRVYIQILTEVCAASLKHGGWKIDSLNEPLTLSHFESLTVEETQMLVTWLDSCNWSDCKRDLTWPRYQDWPFSEERVTWTGHISVPDLYGLRDMRELSNAAQKVVDVWSAARLPLRLYIRTQQPQPQGEEVNEVYNVFCNVIAPHLKSLHIQPDVWHTMALFSAQEASASWKGFLGTVLPQCHQLTALRIQGSGQQVSAVIQLADQAAALHDLVKSHKLRQLDIDCGALPRPSMSLDMTSYQQHERNSSGEQWMMHFKHHIGWITAPESPYFLENLTHLTLRAMFIYRQEEMGWVLSTPILLRHLEVFDIIGLVWAIGFDPERPNEETSKLGNDGMHHQEAEDEGPVWAPKDGDYASYNLERVSSPDEAAAERRRRKTQKKNQRKRKNKALKKAAEAVETEETIGDANPTDSNEISKDPNNVSKGPSDTNELDNVGDTKPDPDPDADPSPILVAGTTNDAPTASTKPGPNEGSKKKKKKKKKKQAQEQAEEQEGVPQEEEGTQIERQIVVSEKKKAAIQALEDDIEKFQLGDWTRTPICDQGLMSWLPGKDDPTDVEDEEEMGDEQDRSSSASTAFGSDPRFSSQVNAALRLERHRTWLIRMILTIAGRYGSALKEVKISGMKLNGQGLHPWDFDMEMDPDIDPYQPNMDEDYDSDLWFHGGDGEAQELDTDFYEGVDDIDDDGFDHDYNYDYDYDYDEDDDDDVGPWEYEF